MADLFENPLGLDGFEFVEFCAPEKGVLEPVFAAMGFTEIARHRSKDVQLWRQGDINLIANYEPKSPAWYFAQEHGPSACGMGWRVRDAAKAYAEAIERGAEPVESRTGVMELRLPAFRGIGGSMIYLIDRYGADLSIYDIDFVYHAGVDRHPVGHGTEDSAPPRCIHTVGHDDFVPTRGDSIKGITPSDLSTQRLVSGRQCSGYLSRPQTPHGTGTTSGQFFEGEQLRRRKS